MRLRVLYINPIAEFSGACKSLVELARNEHLGDFDPVVLCPKGSASDYFAANGMTVVTVGRLSQFDHTRHGRYRGVRWLVALRELLLYPGTMLAIARAHRQIGPVSVIHVNEVTGILVARLAKRAWGCPLVMHIRAHMGEQGRGWRSRWLWKMVEQNVALCVCIDDTVRATVPQIKSRVSVVHNSLQVGPAELRLSDAWTQVLAMIPPGHVKVAIVGSLLRVKGVEEFVEAAIDLCARRENVTFLIVGGAVRKGGRLLGRLVETLGLAFDVERHCRERIRASGLGHRILLTGHVRDPREVFRSIDLLCFPSHYNAPGRPVLEAALFGVPSVVAVERPTPDTLQPGVTGLAIPAKDPRALAEAIRQLLDDPVSRRRMGAAAQELARRHCDPDTNARTVRKLYEAVLS